MSDNEWSFSPEDLQVASNMEGFRERLRYLTAICGRGEEVLATIAKGVPEDVRLVTSLQMYSRIHKDSDSTTVYRRDESGSWGPIGSIVIDGAVCHFYADGAFLAADKTTLVLTDSESGLGVSCKPGMLQAVSSSDYLGSLMTWRYEHQATLGLIDQLNPKLPATRIDCSMF